MFGFTAVAEGVSRWPRIDCGKEKHKMYSLRGKAVSGRAMELSPVFKEGLRN